ncbi:hypothetical protein INT48_008963 [Thamnidium elegans]|uniref:Restriction of telomere capping protein 4 n=1 Tax=Thamnidium elegans TaxID=101142 RepID=A0A8H7VVS8_9FUNG|nr:hypothetical protein INT48_008963 [Thamnidium elegans]
MERRTQGKDQRHSNRDRYPSNSAMARSQPVKPQASFFAPKKKKRLIRPDSEEDDESESGSDSKDDDDFKQSTKKLKIPVKNTSKPVIKKDKNPFAVVTVATTTIDNDMDDFRSPPRLVMTPKLNLPKKNVNSINLEKQTILKSLHASKKQESNNKDKVKCPYCSEILFPMRTSISKALEAIELKDKNHREAEMKLMDKEDEFNMIKTRYISAAEKDEFCQLHYKELVVKPDGFVKGYPAKIDFNLIPQRISKFRKELEDIISDVIQSDYRNIADDAYKEQGVTQARSTMSIIQRFHWSLPGYYGPKGSAIIIQALSDMYLKTGYIKDHLVSQQLPLEFIQQVLVPETGLRLIRQDLIKKSTIPPSNCTSKAKQIMIDSCDYGSIVFPLDQSHID